MRYLTPLAKLFACLLTVLSLLFFPALATAHTVNLFWQASTSQVVGYNVYRGPNPNAYTKINTSLDLVTSYADSTVQAGEAYFYATTAVGTDGMESAYSNQIEIIIPSGGSGSENAVYSFAGGSDPKLPYAGLVFDQAGNLYGTTEFGGAYGQGTVFKMTQNPDGTWTESVIYSFTGGADGSQPSAGLVFDAAGNLYGTTNLGGSTNCNFGCGTVFEMVPSSGGWTESVLYTFTGGADGREPYATLIFDATGNLYGTTLLGGNTGSVCSSGCGTVFKLAPAPGGWTESVLFAFAGGADGASPYHGLVFDPAGNLYGTAYAGGSSGNGVAFQLTPSSGGWTESVLHAFAGGSDGKNPYGGLIRNASGRLFGTAFQGGAPGFGIVYELLPTSKGGWRERVLHTFGNSPSANPVASLVMDTAGNLYGTTMAGATLRSCAGGCGTLFKFAPVSRGKWTYKVLHVFGRGTDGFHPTGDLILDPAGNLFGTTQAGGAQGSGMVFEIMH